MSKRKENKEPKRTKKKQLKADGASDDNKVATEKASDIQSTEGGTKAGTAEKVPYELDITQVSGTPGKFRVVAKSGEKEIYRDTNLILDLASARHRIIFGNRTIPGIMTKLYKDVSPEEWPVEVADEIDERLQQAARVPPGDPSLEERSDKGAITPGGYLVEDGCIYREDRIRGKEKLTNFTAQILERSVNDDGSEDQTCELIIEVTRNGRAKQASVPIEKFASMDWVINRFGPENILSSGIGFKDHLRCAIQELSKSEIPVTTIFKHTGWREFDGVWCFLHAGGAIIPDVPNPPKIKVKLDGPAAGFCLPAPPSQERLRAAVKASLGLVGISRKEDGVSAKDTITFPLLSCTYRAAIDSPDFSLFLLGPTGSQKSEFAALGQQHYGPSMVRDQLPGNWSSTANSLEMLAFTVKDCLLTIDDFAPPSSRAESDRLHSAAERIIRSAGNHSGRQRMNVDGTLKAPKPTRSMIVSTAEDLPRANSIMTRICAIDIQPGDIDGKRLSKCQVEASSGEYASAMAGFIAWLAHQRGEIQEKLEGERIELRDKFVGKYPHARTPDIIANLLLGLRYLLQFAISVQAITRDEAITLQKRGEEAFKEIAEKQSGNQRAVDPVARFPEMIASILSSGRGHLAGKDGNAPFDVDLKSCGWSGFGSQQEPSGKKIGWICKNGIYLDKEAAYAELWRLSSEQGQSYPINSQTLWTRLKSAGHLLLCEPNKTTYPITVEKHRRDLIHLAIGYIFQPEKDDSPEGESSKTPHEGSSRKPSRPGFCPSFSDEDQQQGHERDAKTARKSRIVPVIPVVPAPGDRGTDSYVEFFP